MHRIFNTNWWRFGHWLTLQFDEKLAFNLACRRTIYWWFCIGLLFGTTLYSVILELAPNHLAVSAATVSNFSTRNTATNSMYTVQWRTKEETRNFLTFLSHLISITVSYTNITTINRLQKSRHKKSLSPDVRYALKCTIGLFTAIPL